MNQSRILLKLTVWHLQRKASELTGRENFDIGQFLKCRTLLVWYEKLFEDFNYKKHSKMDRLYKIQTPEGVTAQNLPKLLFTEAQMKIQVHSAETPVDVSSSSFGINKLY